MAALFKNPAACLVIVLAMTIGGIFQFLNLPIALYPNTSQPQVRVWQNTTTMSAREFRERFGKDIEPALQALDGVEKVVGEYNNGSVNYKISFKWGVQNDKAKQDVRTVIDTFSARFPRMWGRPWISFEGQFNSRFFMGLSSDRMSPAQMSDFVNQVLKPAVQGIDGLAEVWVVDWSERRILVTIDPGRLAQYGITYREVLARLQQREYNPSLGQLTLENSASKQVVIKLRYENLEDIRTTVILNRNAHAVLLNDVANVDIEPKRPEQLFKSNGKKTLLFGGYAKPDANIKDVADEFLATAQRIAKDTDPSLSIQSLINPSEFIDGAIDNVLAAVLAGVLITTIITFLFLGSLKDTLIICLAIPLSGLGGFILMAALGIEINLISMGAMALAVGMVVDGATVVLENVVRHLHHVVYPAGITSLDKIIAAVKEVRVAVVASILTTIIVFLPLPFTAPLASAVLGDLAIVIVCVMLVALVLTVCLIPPLIYFFQQIEFKGRWSVALYKMAASFDRGFESSQTFYLKTLRYILLSKRTIYVFPSMVMAALFGAIILLFLFVRQEIMAQPETDKVFVHINIDKPNIKLEESEAIVDDVEARAMAEFGKDIKETFSETNQGSGWILITIKNQSAMKEFRAKLEAFFKNTVYLKYYIDHWTPTQLEIPDPPVLRISVTYNTEEQQREQLKKVVNALDGHELTGRVEANPSTTKADLLTLKPRPNLYRLLGTENQKLGFESSLTGLSSIVSPFLATDTIFDLEVGNETLPLQLRMPEQYLKDVDDVGNLSVQVGKALVPLKSLVTVETESSWSDVYTENGKYKAFVDIWPKQTVTTDRDVIRKKLEEKIETTDGINSSALVFERRDQEIRENINSLLVALLFALVAIFTVIVIQFGSLMQTAIILTAVPLGFIGTGLSLWAFNSTLGINSLLGTMLLSGTAVNNSIIFVDFYNNLRLQQPDALTKDLILETAKLRLKPIMITTLTTILGMLPIAFGIGEGASILQPLGISVCGGLWLSTLLTIYLVPWLLLTYDRRRYA